MNCIKYVFLLLHCFLIILTSCQEKKVIENQLFNKGKEIAQNVPVLMPFPRNIQWGDGKFIINSSFKIFFKDSKSEELEKYAQRILYRIDSRTGLYFPQNAVQLISQNTASEDYTCLLEFKRKSGLDLNTNESYELEIKNNQIKISAESDIGCMRGLETLTQLLMFDSSGFYFPTVSIQDEPRFPWRGLLMDVSRHFIPLDVIKRNIDGMAAVKLNVLHFHFVDDHGWRIESKALPELYKKASGGLFYTQSEIKELVEYARCRGIRVVPEIDVPGHATAFVLAYPKTGSGEVPTELATSFGVFPQVLNPLRAETWKVLDKALVEIVKLFPDEYIHIGGDENNGKQWKANKEIVNYMNEKKYDTTALLQQEFSNKFINMVQSKGKKVVGWEEILTGDLNDKAVVQVWLGKESLTKAVNENRNVILSNGYYLDLMQSAAFHYKNDPLSDDFPIDKIDYLLGGEACMWGEFVSATTIDSRIWPRTIAIAERLWSPKEMKDTILLYDRMEKISIQLENLGLQHISNPRQIIRNIAGQLETEPLEVLASVCAPYRINIRNKGRVYRNYFPLTMWADAITPDPRGAIKFNRLIKEYLVDSSEIKRKEILKVLYVWKNNHERIIEMSKDNKLIKQLERLSFDLYTMSTIGIEILETGKSNNTSPFDVIKISKQKTREVQESTSLEDGRTQLGVYDGFELLFKRVK